MIIGIHPDNMWGCSFSEKWTEFLAKRGVEVRRLDLLAADFLEQAAGCDGIMWRWFHIQQDKESAKRILYTLESCLNKPVFPNNNTAWHFDEKTAQFFLLKALGVPIPDTWVLWDYQEAVQWCRSASYPLVFKLSVGAGSSNVLKIESQGDALKLVERMFKKGVFPMTMNEYGGKLLPKTFRELKGKLLRPVFAFTYLVSGEYPPVPGPWWWKPEYGYAFFQEFLPENAFDTRVTVIGDRAFAFRRMNRPDDFRASGSGALDYDPSKIDTRCIEIAFDVSTKAKFQTMAYDFLYKDGLPVVCEISYTFVDEAVYNCPGHWDSSLSWHAGHLWPEEAQCDDFIREVSLRTGTR
jgi:glutathione synthase/RimK-type ligase-like ATP-grasp enzyme